VLCSPVYCHVVAQGVRDQVCDWCLDQPAAYAEVLPLSPLKRCASCQVVYYCNRDCQKAGWAEHKAECKYLTRCRPRVPTDTVRLLCRILLKLEKADLGDVTLPDGRTRGFFDLMAHEDEIKGSPGRVEAFRCFVQIMKECLGNSLDASLVWQIYCRVLINSVEITNAFQDSLGTGLYIGFSAVDHSCRPNSNAVFKGRTVELRALDAGVTFASARVSYLSEILPTAARQRILQDQYYFTCNCAYCSTDYPQLEPRLGCAECGGSVPVSDIECGQCDSFLAEELLDRYRCWREDAVELAGGGGGGSGGEDDEVIETFQLGKQLCKEPDFLMLKLANLAYSRALAAGNIDLVAQCLQYVLPTERKYYHKHSLALANSLSILAKCLFSLDRAEEARPLFVEAEHTVKVFLGTNSAHHRYLTAFAR